MSGRLRPSCFTAGSAGAGEAAGPRKSPTFISSDPSPGRTRPSVGASPAGAVGPRETQAGMSGWFPSLVCECPQRSLVVCNVKQGSSPAFPAAAPHCSSPKIKVTHRGLSTPRPSSAGPDDGRPTPALSRPRGQLSSRFPPVPVPRATPGGSQVNRRPQHTEPPAAAGRVSLRPLGRQRGAHTHLTPTPGIERTSLRGVTLGHVSVT